MRRHLTLDNLLGLIALAGNIGGSLLIASNTGLTWYGYVLFIIGVIPATYLLVKSNANKSLLLTNLYFVGVNFFGLIRYWP